MNQSEATIGLKSEKNVRLDFGGWMLPFLKPHIIISPVRADIWAYFFIMIYLFCWGTTSHNSYQYKRYLYFYDT
jgi:hypothetical protein